MLKNIFITGSTGFVGINCVSYFKNDFLFNTYNRNQKDIFINDDIVLHFAGKAHDLHNTFCKDEYYEVNTDLTKKMYDIFLLSDAKVFIFLSSVKAVTDEINDVLTEEFIPNPVTHYGKSKLMAEQYILAKKIPLGKRIYILRPCMIHGPGNKGNLNLLYKFVNKGLPWPLGLFENKRSFCSIDNLCFIINELINNDKVPSGVYNIADDDSLSTNELITLISESQGKNSNISNIPKFFINNLAKLGDLLKLPINSEMLNKLTETYIVSNNKIKNAINKPLPLTTNEGLLKTFDSFNKMISH